MSENAGLENYLVQAALNAVDEEYDKDLADAARKHDAEAKVYVTDQGVHLCTGPIEYQLDDLEGAWDFILMHFKLDPTKFEVDRKTVRMKSWQQSKRLENGDRDTIWMYAYDASFKEKSPDLIDDDQVAALSTKIAKWKPKSPRRIPGSGLGPECTFQVGWTDWQIGKSGTTEAVDRILASHEATLQQVKNLRAKGMNIDDLFIWGGNDATEGVANNYESQTFTVELTQRAQLDLAAELQTAGIMSLAPQFDTVRYHPSLCNHGEWTRNGRDRPITSDSDNASGHLADVLQRVFAGRSEFDNVEFVIPHDEFVTVNNLSGIWCGYSHGHKTPTAPKAEEDWLRNQTLALQALQGVSPSIWFTAHRHHFDVRDLGIFTKIGHPTQDGGSKWLLDATGTYSRPGQLTVVVGQHTGVGFSDLQMV